MNQSKETAFKPSLLERWLIWLAAADSEVLSRSPGEILKYTAFGATLLVPFLFGMIAASYAVSTLTSSLIIIVGFALVWGFIIITIDRALLATYRAHVGLGKKLLQFFLRATVAVLMGLTVSHPLTLMLFKDTITSEIEKTRAEEMAAALEATDAAKQEIDQRIQQATANLQKHQQKYQEVVGGNFLNQQQDPVVPDAAASSPSGNASGSQFADIDNQIAEFRGERDRVQSDLNGWQKTYDEEIAGNRSGTPGIGPVARAIERDELSWRREEIRRLNDVIADLTSKRTEMSAAIMARKAETNAMLEEKRRELEKQKLEMFTNQQGQLLEVIRGQISSASEELNRLREEAAQLAENTSDRVANLKEEKRADIMVQTIVLHHLFKKEGGGFALAVYIVIASLFTLIDTIPLIVKFFSPPGLYDKYLAIKEQESKITEKIENKEKLLRQQLLDESKYSKIPTSWISHAQQEFEKLQYLKDASQLGVNVEDLHISDLNEPDEFDSLDPSGLAIPTRSNFMARFELKSNLDKKQHDRKPEKYLALDFTPESARESAKWLLDQADLCSEKGLRGIRIWGSLWSKKQMGKFDTDTHEWGSHAKMLDFDKERSLDEEAEESELDEDLPGSAGDPFESSVDPSKPNGHHKNGHDSGKKVANEYEVNPSQATGPGSKEENAAAGAPPHPVAPETAHPATGQRQAHVTGEEPFLPESQKPIESKQTIIETAGSQSLGSSPGRSTSSSLGDHAGSSGGDTEGNDATEAEEPAANAPKADFLNKVEPKVATAGSNPDMPQSRGLRLTPARKVVEKPAGPVNVLPFGKEDAAKEEVETESVVNEPVVADPPKQRFSAAISGGQPKINGQVPPPPPQDFAGSQPNEAPAKIGDNVGSSPSVSRSSNQASGRISLQKSKPENEENHYSPLEGKFGFEQPDEVGEIGLGNFINSSGNPEDEGKDYATKLEEINQSSIHGPLSLGKKQGNG